MINRLLLIFCFLFASVSVSSCMGVGDIYFETPGGHEICECREYGYDSPVLTKWAHKIKNIDTWYFYKDHIIGKGNGFFIANEYYFIVNEKPEQLQYFKNEIDWNAAISNQKLKPRIYTNWLTINDAPGSFFDGQILLELFIFFVFTMLIFNYQKLSRTIIVIILSFMAFIIILFFFNRNIHSF